MSFSGLDKETYKSIEQHGISTKLVLSLIIYLGTISHELAGQDSNSANEKLQKIMSKSKKQNYEQTLERLREERAKHPFINQNQNHGKTSNQQKESNEAVWSSLSSSPGAASFNSQRYTEPLTSAPTTADTNGNQYVAKIPVDFGDFKVIQDRECSISKVIKITPKTFQKFFLEPGVSICLEGFDPDDDNNYNVVVKLYSFTHLENNFWNCIENKKKYENCDSFVDWIIQNSYKTEVEMNKIISQFNDTVKQSYKIKSPKMLSYGPMVCGKKITTFWGYFICFPIIEVGGKFSERHIEGLIQEVDKIHGLNIIHRDISLRNILIDQEDQVHLIDFNSSIKIPAKDQIPAQYQAAYDNHDFQIDNEKVAKIQSQMTEQLEKADSNDH